MKIKTKTIFSIEINVDYFHVEVSVFYIALNQFNSNLSPFILSETVHKVVTLTMAVWKEGERNVV